MASRRPRAGLEDNRMRQRLLERLRGKRPCLHHGRRAGRKFGAREVDSFSRGAVPSKSYTTLEHDECATSAQLLARYLQAYDPDLPRER